MMMLYMKEEQLLLEEATEDEAVLGDRRHGSTRREVPMEVGSSGLSVFTRYSRIFFDECFTLFNSQLIPSLENNRFPYSAE